MPLREEWRIYGHKCRQTKGKNSRGKQHRLDGRVIKSRAAEQVKYTKDGIGGKRRVRIITFKKELLISTVFTTSINLIGHTSPLFLPAQGENTQAQRENTQRKIK